MHGLASFSAKQTSRRLANAGLVHRNHKSFAINILFFFFFFFVSRRAQARNKAEGRHWLLFSKVLLSKKVPGGNFAPKPNRICEDPALFGLWLCLRTRPSCPLQRVTNTHCVWCTCNPHGSNSTGTKLSSCPLIFNAAMFSQSKAHFLLEKPSPPACCTRVSVWMRSELITHHFQAWCVCWGRNINLTERGRCL